jgi:hypothetical protein
MWLFLLAKSYNTQIEYNPLYIKTEKIITKELRV